MGVALRVLSHLLLMLGFSATLVPLSSAQNLSGIFSPVVNEGHRSAQYRATFDPGTDGFAQRIHYQESISTKLMWRVIGSTRKTETTDIDFDALRGELLWQISDDGQPFQTGLRFDVLLRDEDRPHRFGANWSNQLSLGRGWSARLLLLSSVDFGSNTREGVFLQTRAQLAKALEAGPTLGVQLYSGYGSTENLSDFNDQRHQIGPYASVRVSDDWRVFVQSLYGLTDGSPDTNLRLWLTRSF